VIHTAGVVDDAVIDALDGSRLDRVLAPKTDAALHLDELTRGQKLGAFVLFSSVSGVLGGPGQANYAAANAALDAIATRRRAAGEAGVSVDWGLWAETSDITGNLHQADRARITRSGLAALPSEHGMRLLDAAMAGPDPVVVAAGLDLAALRSRTAAGGVVPALLRSLAGSSTRRTAAVQARSAGLAERLSAMAAWEQLALLTDLVRAEVATVLGASGADQVAVDRAFKDAGFDSLTAVDLRNRLHERTGAKLPATLVFDYPTPAALVEHLHDELVGQVAMVTDADEDRVRKALAELPFARLRAAGVLEVLLRLADSEGLTAPDGSRETDWNQDPGDDSDLIDELDAASLVEMVRETLGASNQHGSE
jgi:polyketide synthase 12